VCSIQLHAYMEVLSTMPMDELIALRARIKELESLLQISELRCAKLDYRLRDLLDRLYAPKSDTLNPAQKLLFGLLDTDDVIQAPLIEAVKKDRPTSGRTHKGGGRYPRPENLPVVRQVIDLAEEQKAGLVRIRDEITKQLEFQPRRFYMLHTVRPVYASPARAHPPLVAALPPQVIPQAGVGVGFVTHVVISKFVDHIPYYRQESIDVRGGVWVPRQARYRYANAAAHLLISIREQLKRKILASRYVQVDETFTKLIDPERRGRSHDAYLWGYLAPHERAIVLEFSSSRSGAILHGFFPPNWEGDVQSDGARMYPCAFKHRPKVRRFGCMAHMRRKVVAALKAEHPELVCVYRHIRSLYRIEAQAESRNLTHEQRGHLRHLQAKPILKCIQRRLWDLRKRNRAARFGKLKEAVDYAYHNWPEIAAYAKVGNGHINIDQNPVERCFRPTKIGLNNYKFIGHPKAGWVSAVIYSVVGTCRLIGVNPEEYLRWVLPKLAAGTNRTTAAGLLPHDFAQLHQPNQSMTSTSASFLAAQSARIEPTPHPGLHLSGRR
jgi:transposase